MTGGVVVVLGKTGRNFGAGMSGGVAYVLDLDESLLNPQAVRSGDLAPVAVDDADAEVLIELLTRHRDHTGSTVAAALLDDFDSARARFSKLMPREYATVRAVLAAAEDEGLDPASDVVWSRIMAGING